MGVGFNYAILLFLTFKPIASCHLSNHRLQMLLRDERYLLCGERGCVIRYISLNSRTPAFCHGNVYLLLHYYAKRTDLPEQLAYD